MKRILAFLSTILALCLLAGCNQSQENTSQNPLPQQKQAVGEASYTLSCGASITAIAGMEETTVPGYIGALEGQDQVLFLSRLEKPASFRSWALPDAAKAFGKNMGLDVPFGYDGSSNYAATYTETLDDVTYEYYITLKEHNGSYWFLIFGYRQDTADAYRSSIPKWCATLQLPE